MDTVYYINAFDKVIPTASTCDSCFGETICGGVPLSDSTVVGAANPDFDPGLPVHFPNQGTAHLMLGAMQAGSSPSARGSICQVIPGFVHVGAHLRPQPKALMVTVCRNESLGGVPQSQTLYLVPGEAHLKTPYLTELRSPFVEPRTLTAELIFDSPAVCGGMGEEWAVALNFKQNGKNDGGAVADADFGPTCQFSGIDTVGANAVEVKLNKTIDQQAPTYGTYLGYQQMTFTMTASLSVDEAGNVSGVATLFMVGPTGVPGSVVAGYELKMPSNFNLASVDAVGVAVVNLKNTYTWVRVTLRKFTLSATPLWPPK